MKYLEPEGEHLGINKLLTGNWILLNLSRKDCLPKK
jgi:hypothetical protein